MQSPPGGFDITRRYVRLRERHANGFVEFDFAIGDPALCVELVMSEHDYNAFCETNDVVHVNAAEAAAIDVDQQKWRYGTPGATE